MDIEESISTKAWYTLKEACAMKNLAYKTACTKKQLQPNCGKPDGHIGGKRVFSRATIINWLAQTDERLSAGGML